MKIIKSIICKILGHKWVDAHRVTIHYDALKVKGSLFNDGIRAAISICKRCDIQKLEEIPILPAHHPNCLCSIDFQPTATEEKEESQASDIKPKDNLTFEEINNALENGNLTIYE